MVSAFQAGQATPLVRRPVRPLAPHVRRPLAARRPSRAERPLPGPGRCARRVVDKRRDRTGRDIVTVPRVHRRAANDPRQATAWQFGRGEIGRVNEHLTRPYVNGPSLDLTDDVTSGWEAGIRTPIRRSRVCSLTVRRPPNEANYQSTTNLAAEGSGVSWT